MPYIDFNTRNIYYDIKGEGEALLLLHGNSVSSRSFSSEIRYFSKKYRTIFFDFPGHGRSERLNEFDEDFWFYNAKAAIRLIEKLKLKRVHLIGTCGGAQVALNVALEASQLIGSVTADCFEGDKPREMRIASLRAKREEAKKNLLNRLMWRRMHGPDWEKIVDMDTEININFFDSGRSYFHKNLSDLVSPVLLTGFEGDKFSDDYSLSFSNSFSNVISKPNVKLYNSGKIPALSANKSEFRELVDFFISSRLSI